VVALKTRSIPADEAVRQSLAALAWLRAQGCRQVVFKICSTFDSTPRGNIGPVGEALAAALGAQGVPVCPAFPATGRRVFQGHLFVGDRLLNESGMEAHPLNPMTDADLRRWLARQSTAPVGFVGVETLAAGPEAVRAALEREAGSGRTLAIVDATTDADLATIGAACRDAPLLVGGSGIALGLPANLERSGALAPAAPFPVDRAGPAAILAGSCSRATLGQVEAHGRDHPVFRISPADLIAGRTGPADALRFAERHREDLPLIVSSQPAEAVAAGQRDLGREAVAAAVEGFFADLARRLVAAGWTRLVVAGGETSGAVVSALGIAALRIGPEIDPGVPALETVGQDAPPLGLALKSGNFGGPDFFARAAAALAGEAR
jgi:uncharacterized protein YgbK (DUF1537 family)